MHEELKASIARIFSEDEKTVIGMGFLVSQTHVLTCAHVIAQALGFRDDTSGMPHGLISLDFPLVA